MFNNSMVNNIGFKSTSGILVKTHPKSKISWCDVNSPFYKGLNNDLILQMLLMSDTRVCVEYLDNREYLDEIFKS